MHRTIPEQGAYLRAVVGGHARYFGVPDNGARLIAFRFQVARLWHRTLCRRSQTPHLRWRRTLLRKALPHNRQGKSDDARAEKHVEPLGHVGRVAG